MSPGELREYLNVLSLAGVHKATVPTGDVGDPLTVEFEPSAAPPLVDEKGKAVSLDEGMPWNAADGDDIDAKIEAANFNPQPKGAQPVVPIEAEGE